MCVQIWSCVKVPMLLAHAYIIIYTYGRYISSCMGLWLYKDETNTFETFMIPAHLLSGIFQS